MLESGVNCLNVTNEYTLHCFANRHTKQLNHTSFTQESTVCTKQNLGSTACYHPLPHTYCLPRLSWCRSFCQKWEFFFIEPEVESQCIVLVGCLTISTNVSCYQTCGQLQYYLQMIILFAFQQHSECTSVYCVQWCVQHSTTAAVQNSPSFLLSCVYPTGQSWIQLQD